MGLIISDLPKDHPLRVKVEQATGEDFGSKKRNNDEHWLQKEAVELFYTMYPKHEKRLFAIPNGGRRDAVTGANLKAEGVLAGVWDLLLAVPMCGYGGCFLETKVEGRKLTDSQKEFRSKLQPDYYFIVYRNLAEFIEGVSKYLSKTN